MPNHDELLVRIDEKTTSMEKHLKELNGDVQKNRDHRLYANPILKKLSLEVKNNAEFRKEVIVRFNTLKWVWGIIFGLITFINILITVAKDQVYAFFN